MNRLIDDLLSLSRIEISEHQQPVTAIAVGEVLRRVAAGREPLLLPRGQALELHVAPNLPPIAADEDQVVQVIENLLDNAGKYGREQGRIRVRAEPAGGAAGLPGVAVTVADDGPGIARVHLPRLTERFYRVDPGRGRRGPHRHRIGAGDRQAHRQPPSRHAADRQRGRRRHDVPDLAAGGAGEGRPGRCPGPATGRAPWIPFT